MSIAAKKHDCPTCRCTEPVDIDAMIKDAKLLERARDILATHHKWQCEAEGLTMEYEHEGKTERVDISQEYGDSTLCEETAEVLSALNRKLNN
ncbi:hypothetical protein [uncultured Roseibium sp.]|uniref:hypothetical protein n=1 Tax=uncultured Roseibium sp. TaxID=1936171 RepID=UPI002614055E|nr:hypothetical protein [uncultured Roseibium sp.]